MVEGLSQQMALYDSVIEFPKVFEAWATTTMNHETERAHKRLRTRIQHVRGSEAQLEQKREHCTSRPVWQEAWPILTFGTDVKVVKAFQSALALLDPS
jgi:hypothetical protein